MRNPAAHDRLPSTSRPPLDERDTRAALNDAGYQYSAKFTDNPYRYALALWRVLRHPRNNYPDVASAFEVRVVEVGFARSRIGRRFSRWDQVADVMRADPYMAERLRAQPSFGPVDLDTLAKLPDGTLGHIFATHCRERGMNPNISYVPPVTEEDWILNHVYETHDVWHVTTGWGNDVVGEIGITGFYISQLRRSRFFALLLTLFLVKAVLFAPGAFAERMEAAVAGYTMGRRAKPIFGVNWAELWEVPLRQIREDFGIDASQATGEGIHRQEA